MNGLDMNLIANLQQSLSQEFKSRSHNGREDVLRYVKHIYLV